MANDSNLPYLNVCTVDAHENRPNSSNEEQDSLNDSLVFVQAYIDLDSDVEIVEDVKPCVVHAQNWFLVPAPIATEVKIEPSNDSKNTSAIHTDIKHDLKSCIVPVKRLLSIPPPIVNDVKTEPNNNSASTSVNESTELSTDDSAGADYFGGISSSSSGFESPPDRTEDLKRLYAARRQLKF